MNKYQRLILKKLHFFKRLKFLSRFYDCKWIDLIHDHSMQVFRTTGKPCSCWMCSPLKYSKKQRQDAKQEIKNDLDNL